MRVSVCHYTFINTQGVTYTKRKKHVIKELSKADYTVYVIESPGIGIISVVIEAKHTGNGTYQVT